MRPLTSFEIQPALLEQKPVLFLNEAMLPIRYLIRQVLADKLPSNLPRLPPEIWCIVIDQHADVCTPEYLPVLPISISGLPHKGERLLHCRLTSFTLPFGDQGAVLASERFMQSTSHFSDTPLRDCERWAFKADEFYAEDTDIVADILFPVDASASAPSTCRSRPLLPTKAGLGSPPPEVSFFGLPRKFPNCTDFLAGWLPRQRRELRRASPSEHSNRPKHSRRIEYTVDRHRHLHPYVHSACVSASTSCARLPLHSHHCSRRDMLHRWRLLLAL